jgi:hypothetical protein
VSASIFRVVYDLVAARGNKHQFGQPLVQWPCWHLLRVDRVNSSPFTSLIDYLLASQPVISARSAPSAQNPAPPVSIFSVAAALAKVQAQLANPEKSLVGTIQSDAAGAVGHHGMEIGLVTARANLSGRPMMCRKSPTQIWRAVIDGE